MTAALKRTVYDDPVESELACWPGVTYRRQPRGKHNALVLSYRGATRFVIYAATPGDTRRGALNHLANVRAELRAMGAVRTVWAKAEGRQRRKPAGPVVSIYEFDRANPEEGPLRDPFAVLASLKVAERAPPAEAVESAAPSSPRPILYAITDRLGWLLVEIADWADHRWLTGNIYRLGNWFYSLRLASEGLAARRQSLWSRIAAFVRRVLG